MRCPTATVEQLAAALRAYHDTQPEAAAIELLIGHNQGSAHWLGRDVFRECVSWMPPEDDDDIAMAQVDWQAAADLVRGSVQTLHRDGSVTRPARPLPDTTSERMVLAVATEIAEGAVGCAATSCDVHNRLLIAVAVVDALGLSWGDVMTAAQS